MTQQLFFFEERLPTAETKESGGGLKVTPAKVILTGLLGQGDVGSQVTDQLRLLVEFLVAEAADESGIGQVDGVAGGRMLQI